MCVIASEGMDCDETIRPMSMSMSMSMIGAGQFELSLILTSGRVSLPIVNGGVITRE